MTLTYETRHIDWHESSKYIYRLDTIICNSKERWNEDKCRCECKELIDKRVCDKGYSTFGIQVIVNVNAINLVILVNI